MPAPTAALLAELYPNTDLAGLVDRVARNKIPRLVIPAAALTAPPRLTGGTPAP